MKNNHTIPVGCEGGSLKHPTAKPGNLCVYGVFENATFVEFFDLEDTEINTAGGAGTQMAIKAEAEAGQGFGDWAVTRSLGGCEDGGMATVQHMFTRSVRDCRSRPPFSFSLWIGSRKEMAS